VFEKFHASSGNIAWVSATGLTEEMSAGNAPWVDAVEERGIGRPRR
jgi:hypothetical protein